MKKIAKAAAIIVFAVLVAWVVSYVLAPTAAQYIGETWFQRALLAICQSLLVLGVGVELLRSAGYVQSPSFTKIIWHAALFCLSWFAARLASSMADAYLHFEIAWFSNLVNAAFWGYLAYTARSFRVILASPRNEPQRIKLRATIDDLIAEIKGAKDTLETLR